MNQTEKLLYIDSQDTHVNDPKILAIHPSKVSFLSFFQSGSFDRAVIQHVSTGELSSLGFFYIGNVLKEGGRLEVYVHQPIKVMQPLEAEEIEALARLAGYSDICTKEYERTTTNSTKTFSTMLLTMTRPKKVLLSK